jgi:hypothetical protein
VQESQRWQVRDQSVKKDETEQYLHPSDVRERDVDLLLLEELHASPDFQRHFLKLLGDGMTPAAIETKGKVPLDSRFVHCHHSVRGPLGQSDLEVAFSDTKDQVWRVLIENKIYAGYQPEQAQRYARRGELHKKQGRCGTFVSVLAAPKSYVGTAPNGFDSSITYESIRSWFEDSKALGLRQFCKVGLLNAAIRKKENVREKSKQITEFGYKYHELVLKLAPELCMPAPVPRSGGFLFFQPPATASVRFIHKVNRGCIDFQFAKMGGQVNKLRELFGPYLRSDRMKIVRAHKSAAIRTIVDKLVTVDDFEEQEEKVKNCILEAQSLLRWWIEHRHLVHAASAAAAITSP